MRRFCCYIVICILLSVVPQIVSATKYEVKDLKSPHATDIHNYICNPDGVLYADECQQINRVAMQLDSATAVEMAVVVIREYNEIKYSIDEFALKLFNEWGVGKAGVNTGVMVLLVVNSRDIWIQTGGGVEGLLPDAKCRQFIDKVIPILRSGRLGFGVFCTTKLIYEELTTPKAQAELLQLDMGLTPQATNLRRIAISNAIVRYFLVSLLVLIVLCIFTFIQFNAHGKQLNNVRYNKIRNKYPLILVCAIVFPFPVVLLAIFYKRSLKAVRYKPVTCPHCRKRMKLLSEQEEDRYLSQAEQTEELVKSIDYDVWLCPSCQNTVILPYEATNSRYKHCTMCGAKTESLVHNIILQMPTVEKNGVGERKYICKNCGFKRIERYEVPKLDKDTAAVIAGGGAAARGGFRSGGFSGGSFGGGLSFGGGAGGKF